MKSDSETVTVDTEKRLAWSEVTVDDKGRTWKTSWDGPADGTMHPLKGMAGASGSWNAATDETKSIMPDGTVPQGMFSLFAGWEEDHLQAGRQGKVRQDVSPDAGL